LVHLTPPLIQTVGSHTAAVVSDQTLTPQADLPPSKFKTLLDGQPALKISQALLQQQLWHNQLQPPKISLTSS